MTAGALKSNRKHEHLYAIIRYETDADEMTPVDLRFVVKKVVTDPQYAEDEVRRRNDLNAGKRSYYFFQVTRLEEPAIEARTLASSQSSAAEGPEL